VKKKGIVSNKEKAKLEKAIANDPPKVMTRLRSKSLLNSEDAETKVSYQAQSSGMNENIEKAKLGEKDVNVGKAKQVDKISKLPVRQTRSSRTRTSSTAEVQVPNELEQADIPRKKTRSSSSNPSISQISTEEDDSSLYTTAVSSPETEQ